MSKTSAILAHRFDARRFLSADSAQARPRVAISACLAGERVRYDGADKGFAGAARLAQSLELLPVCPEVGAGLGVPRPPVQLVRGEHGIQARGRDDATLDVTPALREFAARSSAELREQHTLCGYIWKSRSPSCGRGSTPLFDAAGTVVASVSGIQADRIQREMPWLVCAEDEELLTEPALAAFVLRCRIAFDVRRAGAGRLAAIARHYRFLQNEFSARDTLRETKETLRRYCDEDDFENYLTALMQACGQWDAVKLLSLFAGGDRTAPL